jgi:hypothetical protein
MLSREYWLRLVVGKLYRKGRICKSKRDVVDDFMQAARSSNGAPMRSEAGVSALAQGPKSV